MEDKHCIALMAAILAASYPPPRKGDIARSMSEARGMFEYLNPTVEDKPPTVEDNEPDVVGGWSSPVYALGLSVRAERCLDRANIQTLRELVRLTVYEVKKVRNLGKVTLKELKTKLASLGLSFGMKV